MTAITSRLRPSRLRRTAPPPADPPRPADGGVAPVMATALPDGRVRLRVWQLPVRVTHWVTAGAIVVLSITGVYIADPFLVPNGGSLMGTIRLIHMIAAFTLIASGMLRVIWLIAGNRFSRWTAFFPVTRVQITEIFRQAAFYAFIRRDHPNVLGHNQLAASAYVVLWALLLAETITGFALDGLVGAEPGATGFWWVRELIGVQNLRLVHHFLMWAIIAIALFHMYSCVLIDHLERNGLMSSIFSGDKFLTPEEIVEARDGGPELLARVGIVAEAPEPETTADAAEAQGEAGAADAGAEAADGPDADAADGSDAAAVPATGGTP